MRLRLAAIAAFILSLTYLADFVAAMPPELTAVRGYGLIALTFWCFIETFVIRDAAVKALENAKSDSQHALDAARNDAHKMIAEVRATAEKAKADHEMTIAAAKNETARLTTMLSKAERELETERLKTPEREVINLLALLQSRGRLIDFLMDDITRYADAQVGAAARVVHQGCAGVVREYFDIKPVRQDPEGTSLTLEKDFDAHSVRLLGKVLGEPPFRGRLLHRGWQTDSVKLPRIQADAGSGAGLIAPAEVELN